MLSVHWDSTVPPGPSARPKSSKHGACDNAFAWECVQRETLQGFPAHTFPLNFPINDKWTVDFRATPSEQAQPRASDDARCR